MATTERRQGQIACIRGSSVKKEQSTKVWDRSMDLLMTFTRTDHPPFCCFSVQAEILRGTCCI
ncbi:Hypothetical predicted protein [Podarcis lilfordi]|uniref:Uncharacterized protein n=1 Tax=Podarcis lilfordi TaxID=74358 RepID=A0AA35P9X5_9SAUR|nr:Hypothetical predicted protein [Podarcis lilfordi]